MMLMPVIAPVPPSSARYAAAISTATAPTSGPPKSPAMLRTAERPSTMTPGLNTMGAIMPITQITPKMMPALIRATCG